MPIRTTMLTCLLAAIVFTAGCGPAAPKPDPEPSGPVVTIDTSMGVIRAELWSDRAPITVKNFLAYVEAKHFDGLIFHRVMQGFMIQGGGFDLAMIEKPTLAEIKNEATPDKKNDRGTLAMARTGVVDSATSQFYINLVDNAGLNQRDKTVEGFGYCAFGKVISGMDVVDKIAAVPVGFVAGHANVPTVPVIIKSIRLAE
jgi:cyclophilin family peptidyl-prolyl cis-trans isomerase